MKNVFVILIPAAFLLSGGAFAAADRAAAVPADAQNPYWAAAGFWDRRHQAKLAEIAKGPKEYDCVFVGDSITHNWEGWSEPADVEKVTRQFEAGRLKFPNGPGRKEWDAMGRKWRILNLGVGGDRTQNVLWRFDHGELDGYSARNVMLMIGANNAGPKEEIVGGIRACVERILTKHPESRVLLSPILPSGPRADSPRRLLENAVNEEIAKLADGTRIVWVDFRTRLLEPDGTLSASMMPDFLHPLERGYKIWREAVEPYLESAPGLERINPKRCGGTIRSRRFGDG